MAITMPVFLDAACMNCTLPTSHPMALHNSQMDSISVVATSSFSLKPVTDGLKEFFQTDGKAEGLSYPIHSFTLPEEVDRGDFMGCSYVLLCDDLRTWTDEVSVQKQTQRLCKCMKAAFRVNADVCIALLGDPSDFRSHMTTLCQDYPEFRWLLCSGRLLNIHERDGKWNLTTNCVDTLIAWLTVSGHSFDPQQLLDYKDMGQIIFRDLMEYIPEFVTFLRLGLLSLSGILGILLTGLLLTSITQEPYDERSIRGSQSFLRHTLERQRMGKCEWQPGDDAMALLALQLYQPDWCFHTVENQRSIDRMEVHLLATISRARLPMSRELTPTRLSQYINALLVSYQNPRDFHGHDLVSLLEAHVLRQGRHQRQGPFSRSLSLITLYNAKVSLHWGHIAGLMELQKADGSFGYSTDETCMSAMALACARGEAGVEEALNSSITWLAQQRTPEGSYGHTYSTALALQAFNVTGSRLPGSDWHTSMLWLIRQTKKDPAIRNIEIASQVLLVISDKTMLSIRNFTGLGNSDHDSSHTPRLLPHIYVDGNEAPSDIDALEQEDAPEPDMMSPPVSESSPLADNHGESNTEQSDPHVDNNNNEEEEEEEDNDDDDGGDNNGTNESNTDKDVNMFDDNSDNNHNDNAIDSYDEHVENSKSQESL